MCIKKVYGGSVWALSSWRVVCREFVVIIQLHILNKEWTHGLLNEI